MNWLFKLVLKLNNYPIDLVRKDRSLNLKSDIKLYQEQKSLEIFHYHFKNNRFYQNFLQSKNFVFSNWNSIPIVQKADLQKPIAEILSDQRDYSKYHIHNTSGSSGTPFVFAKDKYCHANAWAYYDQRLLELGINYGADLQARFYGIPKTGFSYWKERLKDVFAGRKRYPVFDLSDEILEKVLIDFTKLKFVYINGYTNAMLVFANYLIRKNIVLKNVCKTLKCAIPTSEVCTEIHRTLMEKAFGVPVFIEYGAAELDVIAMENLDQKLIVNNSTLLVEILDESNNPVKPGEKGRVIVTSLFNKAMPFIRYDIGDHVILSKHTDEFTIIDSIEGRVNDTIILPSGKTSPGLTIYYIAKVLFDEGVPKIQEFVFHQDKLDTFRFEYVSNIELSNFDKAKILDSMGTYLENGLIVEFIRKNHIDRTKSGKLKTFISHLNDI